MPKEAGNEYQGSSFKVNWTLLHRSSVAVGTRRGDEPGGGDEPGEGPDQARGTRFDPIEEEEVPGGPLVPGGGPPEGEPGEPEGEELVPLEEEEVPGGPVKLPKTGETPPFLFYGLGLTLVAGGVALGRKRNKQDYKE